MEPTNDPRSPVEPGPWLEIVADDEDPRRAAHAGRIPKDGSMGWSAAQWKTAIAMLETVARRVKDEHGLMKDESS